MEKILLITGASSDIGMKLIENICQDYSCIYAQYRTMTPELDKMIKNVSMKTKLVAEKCDFMIGNEVDTMINNITKTGELPNQIIHLSAPKIHNLQFHKESIDEFQKNYKVSVESAIKITNAFIKNMVSQKYGRIIYVLSSNTDGVPPKFQTCYTTTKYALLGLMKSLASDYSDKGIKINGISPNMIETKFLSEIPEIVINGNAEKCKNGKNLTVDDIIPTFKELLSDNLETNGENILILNKRE